MKDLERCLSEHSPETLVAIAHAWSIELPEGSPLERVRHLAARMVEPDALRSATEALSRGAREALAAILREGGSAPAQRLVAHGTVRRFGPARLARERPWEAPASPLEEIYYLGLVQRAYGATGDQVGEILLVPDQLRESLADLAQAGPELETLEPPPRLAASGDALLEDLLAVLVHLRAREAASGPPERPPLRVSDLDLGERLQGERSPERLAFVRRMLWRLKLMRVGAGGSPQPSLYARDWLRLPDGVRRRSLWQAWIGDPRWYEFALLRGPTIVSAPGPSDAPTGRRAIIDLLRRVPAQHWLTMEGFLEALRRERPDLMRQDGQYDAWFLRDAATGETLSGLDAWPRVEGVLVRQIFVGPLYWLGLVDLGLDTEDRVVGWRLSARFPDLWATDDATPGPPVATITEGLTVTLPVRETMYARYQLERFAEWLGQGDEASYRITEDSVWHSQAADIKVEQIVTFLRRTAGDALPSAVADTLRGWAERYGRVYLERTVVLRTVDKETMAQLYAAPRVRPLLGGRLDAQTCLVREDQLDELVDCLKALGIWPQIRR